MPRWIQIEDRSRAEIPRLEKLLNVAVNVGCVVVLLVAFVLFVALAWFAFIG